MKKINTLTIVLLAIGLGSLTFGLAYSAYPTTSYPYAYRNGGYGNQWMMGQWSGWGSGQGPGRGPGWAQQPQTSPNTTITLDQAKQIAQQYLASTGSSNLAIKEIMEFQYNFYILYYERDTGRGAFEMLIWKTTPTYGAYYGGYGRMGNGWGMGGGWGMGDMGGNWYASQGNIVPELGPNMMWNTRYGMMGQGIMGPWYNTPSTVMPVTKDQAIQIAQSYLDSNFNGAKAETDPTQFYGYYTMDFTINGNTAGMLSVNGYTGQVWYHSWHGAFIQEVDFN